MTHNVSLTVLLVLTALISPSLRGADNVEFTGTLIDPPPCKINDGGQIDVDFEERVGVKKVDGVNYLKTLTYRITCERDISGLGMTLSFIGQPTSYDGAAVETNLDNLGIRVMANGNPFIMNKPLPINPRNPPVLTAVPVKTPGSTLKIGPFNATATLKAEYQ